MSPAAMKIDHDASNAQSSHTGRIEEGHKDLTTILEPLSCQPTSHLPYLDGVVDLHLLLISKEGAVNRNIEPTGTARVVNRDNDNNNRLQAAACMEVNSATLAEYLPHDHVTDKDRGGISPERTLDPESLMRDLDTAAAKAPGRTAQTITTTTTPADDDNNNNNNNNNEGLRDGYEDCVNIHKDAAQSDNNNSSTYSTLSSTESSSTVPSTSSSLRDSPQLLMIPQPHRGTNDLTHFIANTDNTCNTGPGANHPEDEVVLNLAAALVFIASSTPSPCAFSSSPTTSNETGAIPDEAASDKVKAYAKLQGADWTYYLKKPSLTMGRAPSQNRQFTPGDSSPVDFYLSSADSLSRTHLRIDYNPDRVRWEMSCLGKSGVRVDKRRFEAFCPPIPLYSDTVVTVANATFQFILPLDVANMQRSPFESRTARKRKLTDTSVDATKPNNDEDNAVSSSINNQNNDGADDADEDCEGYFEDTAGLVGIGEYSKPPQSYANLIAEAINSTPNKRMTLSCIYQFLADNYPYFRHTKNGWQNSVRHNLSLNKAFKKVPRGPDEAGKGMLWIIDPDYKHLVDGSIGRRVSVRSRTPDLNNYQRPPPITFVHHQNMMYSHHHHQYNGQGGHFPSNQHYLQQYSQQQQQQRQQQQQQQKMFPILPAPDSSVPIAVPGSMQSVHTVPAPFDKH